MDYIWPFDGKLIPIEVKSGTEGKLKSLHLFMDMAPHPMAIRFYAAGEIGIENGNINATISTIQIIALIPHLVKIC
ncbi:MAG: hypothetical protein ACYCZO_10020 [Daejeonella sp.]